MWKRYKVKYQYINRGCGAPQTTTRTFSGRDRADVIQQLRNMGKYGSSGVTEVYSIEEW